MNIEHNNIIDVYISILEETLLHLKNMEVGNNLYSDAEKHREKLEIIQNCTGKIENTIKRLQE